MKTAIIFGGTGFIGTFFAEHLLKNLNFSKIYLFDHEDINIKFSEFRQSLVSKNKNIIFVHGDVTKNIDWRPEEKIDLIANFAAVHREPGHEDKEYFECNLKGAKNVCKWAESVSCNNIIFTSSIAPYGPSETPKDETSIPVPTTAYGSSKLVAEKIHQIWHSKEKSMRKLLIVRPGVVFGPGEGGNVSRLIKAVIKRYFIYIGNRKTRKAGVYVKELCHAMSWVFTSKKMDDDRFILFNMSMNPGPSIEEYIAAIAKIKGIKVFIPSLPKSILLFTATFIDMVLSILKISHPFSPVRINKLSKSNNILPNYLIENGYEYKYSLEEAFKDWKDLNPSDWH